MSKKRLTATVRRLPDRLSKIIAKRRIKAVCLHHWKISQFSILIIFFRKKGKQMMLVIIFFLVKKDMLAGHLNSDFNIFFFAIVPSMKVLHRLFCFEFKIYKFF